MNNKFSLEVRPFKGNTAANFIVWNEETGEIHEQTTATFKGPKEIGVVFKEYSNKVKRLNKLHSNYSK